VGAGPRSGPTNHDRRPQLSELPALGDVGGEAFDDDYLYFYRDYLTDDRADSETDVIARILGLTPGDRVLDCPCGNGRISARLARRGCHVVGLDASPLMVGKARELAASLGVSIDLLQADMRSVSWEASFDVVINWFTSFGYFDDQTNRDLLARFARALRPGGRLLVEPVNPERFVAALAPGATELLDVTEIGGDVMIDRFRYDPTTGRVTTYRRILRAGGNRTIEYSTRALTFTELRSWLLDAGFTDARIVDDDAFGEVLSKRQLVVATV
jgi:SAM-dependent methyltransferase